MRIWQKFFKDIDLALLVLLAVSLPFEYVPTVMWQDFRIRFSVLIGTILIVRVIIRIVQNSDYRRILQPIPLVILAWTVWIAIGSVQFLSWRSGLKVLVPLLFFGVLAFSVAYVMRRNYLKPVLMGVLVGAAAAALFGLFQYFADLAGISSSWTGLREPYTWERAGFPRIQSVALEPLYFSNYLLLPMAIIFMSWLRARVISVRVLLPLVCLLLLVDVLTLSRGGLGALIILVIASFVLFREKKVFSKVFFTKGLSFIAVLITSVVLALAIVQLSAKQGIDPDVTYNKSGASTFVAHIDNTSFTPDAHNKATDDSINQRSEARNDAVRFLRENPQQFLFGAGVGQYHEAHYREYGVYTGAPNNVILEQLTQTGIVGLLLLAALGIMIVVGLTHAARRLSNEPLLAAACLAMIAYFVAVVAQMQTFSGIGLTHLWFSIGISIFLIQSSQEVQKHAQKTQPSKNKIRTA